MRRKKRFLIDLSYETTTLRKRCCVVPRGKPRYSHTQLNDISPLGSQRGKTLVVDELGDIY